MAHTVTGAYEMMKDPEGVGKTPSQICAASLLSQAINHFQDSTPWTYAHRWTVARPLWEATSSLEFDRRWSEGPQFIISNHDMGNVVEYATPSDVDEFGRFMLTL